MSRRRLTPKQRQFVAEYLLDLNAAAAARRAGYSDRHANGQANKLLAQPHIAAAVEKAMQERSERTGITAAAVLERLAVIAFGDVRKLFRDGRLLRPDELPDEAAPLIAGFDVVTRSAGEGEVEYVAKIKRVDPLKALQLLGRHLGIFEMDNRQRAPVINIGREDAGA